ncbi:MAG: polyphosphate kinase 2 [Gammaproteobacteria bacterium]|nr:MAG: polyphosphate kinase 2 [Gammaproteobacteria bacterium]RLA61883.1 MAG: polyphosphate kinase 2 [Gammaproteobacteria bacterium]
MGKERVKKNKLSTQEYEAELYKLQVELCKLQEWVQDTGQRAIILFEGRDAAGKGGVIRRITEKVSPRVFRVNALPAPSERQKTQMYMQRYIERFPAAGEIILFDRSWYNRAGVERVMGFCTEKECQRFLQNAPRFERTIMDSGIILIKYWFEVSADIQASRFQDRMTDPCKQWKLSPMDLEGQSRWFDYSRAKDSMFLATDTSWAPWHVVDSDNKKRARLNCISHLLSQFPYKNISHKKPVLLPRQSSDGYGAPDYEYKYVPERF